MQVNHNCVQLVLLGGCYELIHHALAYIMAADFNHTKSTSFISAIFRDAMFDSAKLDIWHQVRDQPKSSIKYGMLNAIYEIGDSIIGNSNLLSLVISNIYTSASSAPSSSSYSNAFIRKHILFCNARICTVLSKLYYYATRCIVHILTVSCSVKATDRMRIRNADWVREVSNPPSYTIINNICVTTALPSFISSFYEFCFLSCF